jgi:hypothetical protein
MKVPKDSYIDLKGMPLSWLLLKEVMNINFCGKRKNVSSLLLQINAIYHNLLQHGVMIHNRNK